MKLLRQFKHLKTNYIAALAMAAGIFSASSASAQCPGTLMVNEISNGPDGNKEFVELIAAQSDLCGPSDTEVDVRGWIIDDNNGFFSGTDAFNGLGISRGHYRLADDPLFASFERGKYIVLFNFQDYDASVAGFSGAAANVLSGGYLNTDSALYIAVGVSPLVEKNTTSPAADSTGGDTQYCTSVSYEQADTYSTIGLRNACGGDGIQVRCPGCSEEQGLGEPSFFHGISYGYDNDEQTNPNGFLNAAHLAFDTIGGADTLCGTLRTFYLNNGTGALAPQVSANWTFGLYSAVSTPGAPNSVNNTTFRNNVANGTHQYAACPQPQVGTVGEGALLVTEISNGPSGSCEYVELVVISNENSVGASHVDIRGWILDDNNGDFSLPRGASTGRGISSGHLRLAFNDTWDSVAVGSIIVIFNNASTNNCYNFPTTNLNAPDANGVYWQPVGGDVANPNIESRGGKPSSSDEEYCNGAYTSPATSWAGPAGLGNTGDAFQVRCPGCNDVQSGEPSFYHGFGYGSSTQFFSISRVDGVNMGGPVYSSSSSTGVKYVFNGSTSTAYDVSDIANWNAEVADSAGIITTAGQVGGNFIAFIQAGFFAEFFPSCGSGSSSKVAGNSGASTTLSGIEKEGIVRNVYPNPVSDILNMDVQGAAGSVQLLDINGKMVFSREISEGETTISIDVASLPAGVYIYNVKTNKGSDSGKVMIQ